MGDAIGVFEEEDFVVVEFLEVPMAVVVAFL